MTQESKVSFKTLDDQLVAGIPALVQSRAELRPLLETLRQECGEAACGPGFALIYLDSGLPGLDAVACLPVSRPVEKGSIHSWLLEGTDVMCITHHGPIENIRESYMHLFEATSAYALNPENTTREVYLVSNPAAPGEDVTEIQRHYIDWEGRFARHAGRVLGAAASAEVAQALQSLTPETPAAERAEKIIAAVACFNCHSDEAQRYEAVSSCAHTFSKARITRLQEVYQQNQDVDDVLAVMWQDDAWYEHPTRQGNVIYVTKVPGNPEAFAKATTPAEKGRAYCHCAIARHCLETLSPTFCYCGAGWYRQIWEGILDAPVRIDIVKSLLLGDDTCQFAIHLPG